MTQLHTRTLLSLRWGMSSWFIFSCIGLMSRATVTSHSVIVQSWAVPGLMLLQHKPLSAALGIVVSFSLQYPPIPIYEDWMSAWTNVSTLKNSLWAWGWGEEGKCGWLHCSTHPGVLLLQPRAHGSSQLEPGWGTASLEAWPGTALLFPGKSSLLASSIGITLEMSTNKWNITTARSEVLSPSCSWQTLKTSSSLKVFP